MIHFYTANLTLRTVRAGHARPAGLPLHPVHLNPVGEGFIPPGCPTQPPNQRPTRRGGIHAARAPCLYHQPNPPPPCRGRACPAPQPIRYHNLWPMRSKSPTCTLPKNPSRNLSKKSKTALDNSHTHCYNKQAVPRRRPRQDLLSTACTRFLKKTSSKNFQKTP